MSPAYTFFLVHMADLIDAGHALPLTSWKDEDLSVLYAKQNGKIVAVIVYSTKGAETFGFNWSVFGAVAPELRRQGIYGKLYKYLEDITKKIGCTAIISRVHKDNTVRLEGAAKSGMSLVYYYMIKDLR